MGKINKGRCWCASVAAAPWEPQAGCLLEVEIAWTTQETPSRAAVEGLFFLPSSLPGTVLSRFRAFLLGTDLHNYEPMFLRNWFVSH